MKKLILFLKFSLFLFTALILSACAKDQIYETSEDLDTATITLKKKSNKCISAPANLQNWWTGDGTVYDIKGGNNGMLYGDAAYGTGIVDQAFQLDGFGDFIMLNDNITGDFGTDDFTIDLWVNFASTYGEQVMIEKWVQNGSGDFSTGWTLTKLGVDNNIIRLALDDGSGEVVLDALPPSIELNTWNLVAATRSGNTFTLYWNGNVIGEPLVNDYDLNSTANLKFGHRGNSVDTPGSQGEQQFYLNGLIDEIEIFDRALSATEIQSIYEAGSAGKCKIMTICHKPGSKAAQTLEIPVITLQAHLDHGDSLGPCD